MMLIVQHLNETANLTDIKTSITATVPLTTMTTATETPSALRQGHRLTAATAHSEAAEARSEEAEVAPLVVAEAVAEVTSVEEDNKQAPLT